MSNKLRKNAPFKAKEYPDPVIRRQNTKPISHDNPSGIDIMPNPECYGLNRAENRRRSKNRGKRGKR